MKTASSDNASRSAGATTRTGGERTMRPRVEVLENAEGITLLADLPGVTNERLDLQVDKDNLLIEGRAEITMPEGMQAVHAEVRSKHYRRAFSLSGELDTDHIRAALKDGVLSVHIPKRAEVRPRRIEVRID